MRLNKLKIRSFRNINDTTLDATGAKFVVIRGKNGQGKTSISEALSLALTETTWGLDKRGAGFARKVKRGETKATIEVDLQGANRTIRRTTSLSITSTGRTQSSQDINDPNWHPKKFDDLLDYKKAALGIALNTRAFMGMVYSRDEDSQKNLLAQLVLPSRYEFPKNITDDVIQVLGEGTIDFSGEPFAVIGKAYKKLFDERTAINKKVKEFVISEPMHRPQGVDSASLKRQLDGLKSERQKQSAERDAAAKQANEALLRRERASARIETLEAVLRVNKDNLRTLESAILPDPQAVQEMADRKARRDQLLVEQQKIVLQEDAAKKELKRLNELSGIGDLCPTCEQPIDDAKLIELATQKAEERTRLREAYDKTAHALAALGDVDGATEKLEKHKKALAEKGEVTAKIQETEMALEEAKNESNKSFGNLFDSASLDNAITGTDQKIEAILRKIQPIAAAEEREKDILAKKEQLRQLEQKAVKLDGLVKIFDKDGIKAKLIAEHIGGFEAKVNEVLRIWNYSCALSIEPFKFEITDYRNVSTALIDLSGAEELMFYAAFQCAVSRTAGIGFVVIDRVDTLLADLRPIFFKKLYDMVKNGLLDQVVLLIADTSEQVPKLSDTAFFAIEEGNVRRLD